MFPGLRHLRETSAFAPTNEDSEDASPDEAAPPISKASSSSKKTKKANPENITPPGDVIKRRKSSRSATASTAITADGIHVYILGLEDRAKDLEEQVETEKERADAAVEELRKMKGKSSGLLGK